MIMKKDRSSPGGAEFEKSVGPPRREGKPPPPPGKTSGPLGKKESSLIHDEEKKWKKMDRSGKSGANDLGKEFTG